MFFFCSCDVARARALRGSGSRGLRNDTERRKVLREQINVIVPPFLFCTVSSSSSSRWPSPSLGFCVVCSAAFLLLLFLARLCVCMCLCVSRSAGASRATGATRFVVVARSLSLSLALSVVVFRVPLLVTMSREDTKMLGRRSGRSWFFFYRLCCFCFDYLFDETRN